MVLPWGRVCTSSPLVVDRLSGASGGTGLTSLSVSPAIRELDGKWARERGISRVDTHFREEDGGVVNVPTHVCTRALGRSSLSETRVGPLLGPFT